MTEISFELLSCFSLFDRSISLRHFLHPDPGYPDWSQSLESALWRREDLEKAQAVLAWCQSEKVTVLYPSHPDYPEAFYDLEFPPLFLTLRGHMPWLKRSCVSVVGSREPTWRALEWMDEELGAFIRSQDLAVVSGGARGVDQRAHALSLRAGRPTVVFLPSGIARPYPKELTTWQKEVIDGGGAILSEFHPQQEVRKMHFERRNRMIAALGSFLLVVEARRRSGSLVTARLARELSRTVGVVPNFPTEAAAAGGVDLLFDGAQPIRDRLDLSALLGLSTPSSAQGPNSSNREE